MGADGGYHIHVKPDEIEKYNAYSLYSGLQPIDKNKWYNFIMNNFKVDKDAQPSLSPIVGCCQGGHIVKLLIPGKDF